MAAVGADPWQGELAPSRTYRMLVDGELVDGETGETFRCEYPFTGEAWGSVPVASAADVDRAVRAAQRAFDGGWAHG